MPTAVLSPLFAIGDRVYLQSEDGLEEGVVHSFIDNVWLSVLIDGEEVDCCFDDLLPLGRTSDNDLESIKNDIVRSFIDCENAAQTAETANKYALLYACKCGTLLNQAKELVAFGDWEKWRKENIIIHGAPIPSSTASIYSRIAKNWEYLASAGVSSVRDAVKMLASMRSKPLPTEAKTKALRSSSSTFTNQPANQEEKAPKIVIAKSADGDPNPWFNEVEYEVCPTVTLNISIAKTDYWKLKNLAESLGKSIDETICYLVDSVNVQKVA